jgi:hypothetical protein
MIGLLKTYIAKLYFPHVRADGNVYVRDAEGGTKLGVSIGSRINTEATGPAMHFLRRALAAKEFVAGDCCAWGNEGVPLAWRDVEEFLRGLVEQGLFERIS